jgi:hypothetical protein
MNALAELSGDYAAENDWLVGRLAAVSRRDRRIQQSRLRKAKVRSSIDEARDTARAIGSLVWTATDEADLVDMLDAQANDLQASKDARKVAATLYACQFNDMTDPAAFLRGVCAKVSEDSVIVTDLLESLRIGAVISGLYRKSSQSAPGPEASRPDWEGVDIYALPTPLLSTVLAHARGTACLAALVDLVLSNRPPPPRWLAERVARGWASGERSLVRFLTLLYDDADVPEDIVPLDQRLRRDQVVREHN